VPAAPAEPFFFGLGPDVYAHAGRRACLCLAKGRRCCYDVSSAAELNGADRDGRSLRDATLLLLAGGSSSSHQAIRAQEIFAGRRSPAAAHRRG